MGQVLDLGGLKALDSIVDIKDVFAQDLEIADV
jgi:hypothetical protein